METFFDHISKHHPLSKAAQASLSKVLHKVELAKGSYLITEGKTCSHLYFMEKGCLRGYYNLEWKGSNILV